MGYVDKRFMQEGTTDEVEQYINLSTQLLPNEMHPLHLVALDTYLHQSNDYIKQSRRNIAITLYDLKLDLHNFFINPSVKDNIKSISEEHQAMINSFLEELMCFNFAANLSLISKQKSSSITELCHNIMLFPYSFTAEEELNPYFFDHIIVLIEIMGEYINNINLSQEEYLEYNESINKLSDWVNNIINDFDQLPPIYHC